MKSSKTSSEERILLITKLERIEKRRKHRECKIVLQSTRARGELLMDFNRMEMTKQLMSKNYLGCRTLSNHMEHTIQRKHNSSPLLRHLKYLKRSLDSSPRVKLIMRFLVLLSRSNLHQKNLPNLILKKINLIQQALLPPPKLKKTLKNLKLKTYSVILKLWKSSKMLSTAQNLATVMHRRMTFHMKKSRSTTSHLSRRSSSLLMLHSKSEPKT